MSGVIEAGKPGDFKIGEWLCQPELNRISSSERTVQLEPKVMAVIALLAERSGRVVTREELLDAVWPQTSVTEQVLTRAVSELRKALGDDSRSPRIIETIAKGGYRLIAPVEWMTEAGRTDAATVTLHRTSRPWDRWRGSWLLPIGIAIGILIMTLLGWIWSRSPPVRSERTLRLSLVFPAETAPGMGSVHAFALSPDGRQLVYTTRIEGRGQLYIRSLARDEARALPGTEEAFGAFFSPDGRSIGFYRMGELLRVALDGGAPILVTKDAFDALGADWADDGTIVYTRRVFDGLYAVPSVGGLPRALTRLNGKAGEISHAWPHFLPGGKRLLFTVWRGAGMRTHDIELLDLNSGERRTLIRGGSRPHYLPDGRLLFARSGQLMMARFDLRRLELTDTPYPVIEGLRTDELTGAAHYEVSRDGTLVYASLATSAPFRSLYWIAQNGVTTPIDLPPRAYANASLSPDGRRIVANRLDSTPHIFLFDLMRGTTERLTSCEINLWPVWAPRGDRLVFTSNCDGAPNLYWKEARADAPTERLTTSDRLERAGSWSADGRLLAYDAFDPKTRMDIWLLSLAGKRRPIPFLTSEYDEADPALSPDGRLIAYVSNLAGTGLREVYMRSMDDDASRTQISSNGGGPPLFWSSNGATLYYRSGDALLSVSVERRPGLHVGQSVVALSGLNDQEIVGLAPGSPTRFLALSRHDPSARVELKVIVGWSTSR